MIDFRVRGLPVAQGSARAFVTNGRARVITDGSRPNSPIGAWRGAIATEARSAMGERETIAGPVGVEVAFYWRRPQGHWHTPLHGAGIRETAPTWHATKPDIDKLARAVLDAITAVAIRDDSQVVELIVHKRYETATEPIGASIRIWDILP